jgi:hypothetical protein
MSSACSIGDRSKKKAQPEAGAAPVAEESPLGEKKR